MFNKKKILALIPARGGSKSLPGKNTKMLNGKPLIAWSIDAAKNSKYIDRVVVSTDSVGIAKISKEYGADVPFIRPNELATDTATSLDVIIHCMDWLKEKERTEYDYLVLLQPTSPLRNNLHIDRSIEKFFSNKKTQSLVSVTRVKKNPYWMKVVNENGFLDNIVTENKVCFRRQDLSDVFVLNGAIYVIGSKDLILYKGFNTPFTSYYEMDEEHSVDIDDLHDFMLAKKNMERLLKL